VTTIRRLLINRLDRPDRAYEKQNPSEGVRNQDLSANITTLKFVVFAMKSAGNLSCLRTYSIR